MISYQIGEQALLLGFCRKFVVLNPIQLGIGWCERSEADQLGSLWLSVKPIPNVRVNQLALERG
jgi:hypothetical protein